MGWFAVELSRDDCGLLLLYKSCFVVLRNCMTETLSPSRHGGCGVELYPRLAVVGASVEVNSRHCLNFVHNV